MDGTVLVADDDRTIRTVLTQALTRAGCRVHATSSLATLTRWVEEGRGDAVVTDVMMPDGNGIDNLRKIKSLRGDLPVIVISAQNTIMTAIQATEAEAFDYLPKPFDLPDLLARVAKALEGRRRGARVPAPDPAPPVSAPDPAGDLPLVGSTPAMQALYRLVARVMNADLPVLVTGESGTGKSLIAKALHDFSDRRDAPFRVLSARELERDGARQAWPAESPAGGTLVIDGLADLPAPAQARLVRLLDELAGAGPRVVAIADEALAGALASGAFRQDLYFRLCGVELKVPPLRERLDDIALLAEHFLARAARDGGAARRLSPQALDLMRRHPWPGNVRQLENVVRRLAITGQEPTISKAELEQALGTPARTPLAGAEADGSLGASVARHVRRYFELHGAELPQPGVHQRILREVEAPLIEIALEYTNGNQAKCAELLGINRNTLRKKLTELDIRVTRRRKLM